MHAFASTAIDSIQSAKTQFLNTFVPNESIRAPLQDWVNAQAQFARQSVSSAEKFFEEVTKMDLSKEFNKFVKTK
ncbi:MAG: hypothetical protein EBS04_08725 [Chitinophagia bacterium]|nr:hypothetical protein [Chitinophagia bacterium]